MLIAIKRTLRALLGPLLAFAALGCFFIASAGGADSSKLRERVAAALKAQDHDRVAQLIGEIGALDDPKAVGWIVTVGTTAGHPAVYDACVKALASAQSESVVETIAKYLTARSPAAASLAAEVLTKTRLFEERVRPALLKALLDLRRYPRFEAIQTIVLDWLKQNRGKRWALRALIDMRRQLSKRKIDDGSLFYNVVESLWQVTGQEYDDMEDWEKFWETQASQPEWSPPATDGAGAVAVGKTALARRLPSFFGKEIRSARALFLIDVSGTMTAVDPGQSEVEEAEEPEEPTSPGKTVVKRGKRKGETGEPSFGEPGRRTRIERVKRQLYRMIQKYPAGRHFAIVAFSTDVQPIFAASKGETFYSIQMTPRTRQDALERIMTLTAEGLTRTDLAFETAFRFEGVDTIYLLSDGYPQRDPKLASLPPQKRRPVTEKLIQEILDYVKRKNHAEGRRWEIHALGFPKANLGNFLSRLAAANYGQFSEVK